MLRNVVYAGYIQNESTDFIRVKGLHEPYIDLSTYETIQAILAGKGRPDSKPRSKNLLYPLKKLLICGICNKPLTASSPKGRTKHYSLYHCHRCTKKKNGATVSIPRDLAHQIFEEELKSIRPAPWVSDVFREIVLRRWNEDFKETQSERRRVDSLLKQLEDKKNTLVDKVIDGTLSDQTYRERETRLAVQRGELELRRKSLHEKEVDKERIVDNAVEILFDLPRIWNTASIDDKQRFQSAIFLSEIAVYPSKTFGTAKISPIVQEATEVESFINRNKIDLSEEKSIMAGHKERL